MKTATLTKPLFGLSWGESSLAGDGNRFGVIWDVGSADELVEQGHAVGRKEHRSS